MIPQFPTLAGFAAHLARGACGHILCAHAERCSISSACEPDASPVLLPDLSTPQEAS